MERRHGEDMPTCRIIWFFSNRIVCATGTVAPKIAQWDAFLAMWGDLGAVAGRPSSARSSRGPRGGLDARCKAVHSGRRVASRGLRVAPEGSRRVPELPKRIGVNFLDVKLYIYIYIYIYNEYFAPIWGRCACRFGSKFGINFGSDSHPTWSQVRLDLEAIGRRFGSRFRGESDLIW